MVRPDGNEGRSSGAAGVAILFEDEIIKFVGVP